MAAEAALKPAAETRGDNTMRLRAAGFALRRPELSPMIEPVAEMIERWAWRGLSLRWRDRGRGAEEPGFGSLARLHAVVPLFCRRLRNFSVARCRSAPTVPGRMESSAAISV